MYSGLVPESTTAVGECLSLFQKFVMNLWSWSWHSTGPGTCSRSLREEDEHCVGAALAGM